MSHRRRPRQAGVLPHTLPPLTGFPRRRSAGRPAAKLALRAQTTRPDFPVRHSVAAAVAKSAAPRPVAAVVWRRRARRQKIAGAEAGTPCLVRAMLPAGPSKVQRQISEWSRRPAGLVTDGSSAKVGFGRPANLGRQSASHQTLAWPQRGTAAISFAIWQSPPRNCGKRPAAWLKTQHGIYIGPDSDWRMPWLLQGMDLRAFQVSACVCPAWESSRRKPSMNSTSASIAVIIRPSD